MNGSWAPGIICIKRQKSWQKEIKQSGEHCSGIETYYKTLKKGKKPNVRIYNYDVIWKVNLHRSKQQKIHKKEEFWYALQKKNVQNELWKNLQERFITKRDWKTSWIGIKLSRREILDSKMNGRKWEWLYFIHEKFGKDSNCIESNRMNGSENRSILKFTCNKKFEPQIFRSKYHSWMHNCIKNAVKIWWTRIGRTNSYK